MCFTCVVDDMQPLAKAKASIEKENCVISSELKKSFTSGEVGGDCLLQAGKEVKSIFETWTYKF